MQPQPCDCSLQQKAFIPGSCPPPRRSKTPIAPPSRIYHCVTPAAQMSLISPTFRLTFNRRNSLSSHSPDHAPPNSKSKAKQRPRAPAKSRMR
ncbi:hypothetical protein M431DRAFT_496671 [Trichoderma harzianum CBS 226.95]|uniref:Uncharacterized protein n=1 Tax=Trichoderma harzianum CBS 226.95 TaxID=983964 RepID=A0A2T4A8H0_TRIHA|nr:hypothetical protein M431DRAFT_496671 [Trichoderma harzianum CBS 226.95]PTB53374.1 hypothetical protein M431DRAFT_496671 [Trichoderma harzianum CBS 226.95]